VNEFKKCISDCPKGLGLIFFADHIRPTERIECINGVNKYIKDHGELTKEENTQIKPCFDKMEQNKAILQKCVN